MRSRKSSCTIDPPLSETTNFPSSIFRSTCNIFVVADNNTLLKMGCLKTPLQGCSSTGAGVWVFNSNPRVSKGCEVLKVGCLKHPYRGVPGVWVLDIKICVPMLR